MVVCCESRRATHLDNAAGRDSVFNDRADYMCTDLVGKQKKGSRNVLKRVVGTAF